ncbi:MAG TPA: carboxymuconolactone decarboxylase family protein [Stellaceae bacterium]|nr:carboxymuconolactone decarboxylase family protein [Stellaceae bacterium]
MEPRLDVKKVSPAAFAPMAAFGKYLRECGLDERLQELVKIRASQINGCAFCLAMHVRDAKKLGESDDRLHLLSVWPEAPIYSERERAALAWTEAVTLVADGNVPDEVYDETRRHFSEKELVDLTFAIVAINAWNRINVAFRTPPQLSAAKAA